MRPRLTAARCSGIKSGYWSPAKKEELVQRLAAYEDTGLDPEECGRTRWIACSDRMPKEDRLVLASVTGRYHNITYVESIELARWNKAEGWVVEANPEWEGFTVTGWAPVYVQPWVEAFCERFGPEE